MIINACFVDTNHVLIYFRENWPSKLNYIPLMKQLLRYPYTLMPPYKILEKNIPKLVSSYTSPISDKRPTSSTGIVSGHPTANIAPNRQRWWHFTFPLEHGKIFPTSWTLSSPQQYPALISSILILYTTTKAKANETVEDSTRKKHLQTPYKIVIIFKDSTLRHITHILKYSGIMTTYSTRVRTALPTWVMFILHTLLPCVDQMLTFPLLIQLYRFLRISDSEKV